MTRPQFTPRICPPRRHLEEAGRLYPDAWRLADAMRERRGAGMMWPDWCYLPIAGTATIVAQDAGLPVETVAMMYPERIADAARLAALCAWRMTQGIYRFDAAVYDAVRDTPVSGDIPHDVLMRLPEWCVYIETPGLQIDGRPLAGTFAHLEWDWHDQRPELRLLLDVDMGDGHLLQPIPLHLGAWPLAESIQRMLDVSVANAAAAGLLGGLPDRPTLANTGLRETVEPIVSLLLYLCSQAAEIGDGTRRPHNPEPKRTKRGWRLFQPDRVTTWDVGVRLGAALRRAYQAEQTGSSDAERSGPRPHIRRAHWHGYWSGPRDGERRYDLRWMPPIAVNVDDVGELPAVVRPVR